MKIPLLAYVDNSDLARCPPARRGLLGSRKHECLVRALTEPRVKEAPHSREVARWPGLPSPAWAIVFDTHSGPHASPGSDYSLTMLTSGDICTYRDGAYVEHYGHQVRLRGLHPHDPSAAQRPHLLTLSPGALGTGGGGVMTQITATAVPTFTEKTEDSRSPGQRLVTLVESCSETA